MRNKKLISYCCNASVRACATANKVRYECCKCQSKCYVREVDNTSNNPFEKIFGDIIKDD